MPRVQVYLTEETYEIWLTLPDSERSAWVQEQLYELEKTEKKQTNAKAN